MESPQAHNGHYLRWLQRAQQSSAPCLYLASQSSRRRELLTQMGVPFESIGIEVQEPNFVDTGYAKEGSVHLSEAIEFARDTATWKMKQGLKWIQSQRQANPEPGCSRPVLGSDTVIFVDGHVLEKPDSKQAAQWMLSLLSAQVHQVVSAVALGDEQRQLTQHCCTDVTFAKIDAATIDEYLATGEYQGKAGGYAIQGLAAHFIKAIRGSYSGVMGLPIFETSQLLQTFFGYDL